MSHTIIISLPLNPTMATFHHFSPIIFLTILPLLLISHAHSLKCTSQTFTHTPTKYTHCTDLPSLRAYLHWTHHTSTSTLSVAFMAPPSTPHGWIAWGINPTSTRMVGTQALVAFKDSKGLLNVKTYDLLSYGSIQETSKLSSFKVLESKAEDSNGTMMIFAKLALLFPVNTSASLNHVWQVGGSVKNGVPEKHDFASENLGGKGTLVLVKAAEGVSASPSSATGGLATGGGDKNATTSAQSENETSGGVLRANVGVLAFLLTFGIALSLSF